MGTTPSAVASSVVKTATKESKVTTRAKPITQADVDAMIANAVAKTLADVVPGIVAAVVAKLTPAPVVAPVAPVPAPVAVVAPLAATVLGNKTWNCQAFVGKIDDRTTKNGAKELVLHVKPSDTWRYPVAYKATREMILALGLAVGDKVALNGFVSTNTRTDGPYAGNTYTKFVIQDCKVMSAKADRLAANAAKAGAVDMGLADAIAETEERLAELKERPGAVASAVPASEAQQSVLAQAPHIEEDLAF